MSRLSVSVHCGWQVHAVGHRVLRGRVVLAGEPEKVRYYDAFRDRPGQFLDFAKWVVTGDQTSVLAFANTHGDLWSVNEPGSTIREWFEAADELRSFVAAGPVPADWNHPESLLSTVRLTEMCLRSPMKSSAQFMFGPGGIFAATTTLLGAMWLQAANAAANRTQFLQCSQCSRHVPVTPKLRPGPRVFCSDKCRYESFKDRKAEAMQMLAEGQSVKQVAAALGSSVDTVSGWLVPKKRVRGRPRSESSSQNDSVSTSKKKAKRK